MSKKESILTFLFLLNACIVWSSDNTRVEIKLKLNEKNRLNIAVYPPDNQQDEWVYVIPQIVPGTYMSIKYERFYQSFKAVGRNGNALKIKRKDNHIYINGKGEQLDHLEYEVEQSLGDGPVWEMVIGCAGTIFTDSSYLINFQLINGYFKGYERSPFKLTFHKTSNLYGASSLQSISRGEELDEFWAKDYASLVDQPILYAKPDTTSIMIGSNTFEIAIYSEKGYLDARKIQPAVARIMHAVDSFSGFTTAEDYHFLMYFINSNRVKGMFSGFGLGSALEHKQSSVYYYSDNPYYDSLFSPLDGIGPHEYFHTISPLNLHSEQIHDFNFDQPDMSAHLWLYEGVTDYLSVLLNAQYNLSGSFTHYMTYAIETSLKKRAQNSMTLTSREIIKKNNLNWLKKILQLIDFYERGKLVAFAMDMELMMHSDGKQRLIDVLLQMKADYKDTPFEDAVFGKILANYTYPEMVDFYERNIEGGEQIPYQQYLSMLGYRYKAKGDLVLSYGSKLYIGYNFDRDQYDVRKAGKNTLGLKKGDVIINLNGVPANKASLSKTDQLFKLYRPSGEQVVFDVKVLRQGKELALSGRPDANMKLKYARIDTEPKFTAGQLQMRELFFKTTKKD